jgi:hypothetical protein
LNAILKNQPTIDAVETLIKLALRELSSWAGDWRIFF